MKIANVATNGMNKYGSVLCDWVRDRRPDIVTIQKIGPKEHFPEKELCKIDYNSEFLGHSCHYLGVAILSHRELLKKPKVQFCKLPGPEGASRFLTVSIGDLWVSSVYVPPPSPTIARTVDWLNRLRDHVCDRGYAHRDSLLCGDFNVRADDARKGKLQHALEELKSLGFVDLYRKAHPNREDRPGHTRGYGQKYPSRLHLILASKSLAQCRPDVCLDVRSRPRKDAPPLVVELEGVRV